MLGDSSRGNRCLDCSLTFDSPLELQNHKRKFCLNSGYDNLEGLNKRQWQGGAPPNRPEFSHKNYLQQYGSSSLGQISEYKQLNSDNLEKDMKNINKFKRQIQRVHKYKHDDPVVSQASSKTSNVTQLTHNSYSQSRLSEELKKYQKPVKEQVHGPTFIDQLNMRNHTVLDKSNSSIGRMPTKDKIEYARVKLDQLNSIKALYAENGGNRPDFKANVQKMIDFYDKLVKEQQLIRDKETNQFLNESQQLIESRCSTPILKLRDLSQSNQSSSQASSTSRNAQRAKNNASTNNNNVPPQNPTQPYGMNGYPPVIMMPYPQQPAQPNDSLRVLEKMMQLKSQENKQLMQILLQDRRRLPIEAHLNPPMSSLGQSVPQNDFTGMMKKKGVIDVQEAYQFKKSMADDLLSEEKVLLSLQQQELDELKMLSQLPRQLQEIKLQSVIKSADTRFQVEKEILKQKMERLAYQQKNQTFEEERKLNNDRWAGQQRKKLLEKQVDRYIEDFQGQFLEK